MEEEREEIRNRWGERGGGGVRVGGRKRERGESVAGKGGGGWMWGGGREKDGEVKQRD